MKYSQYDTLQSTNNNNNGHCSNSSSSVIYKHKMFVIFILLAFSIDVVVSHYLFQLSLPVITWLHTYAYYLTPIAKLFSFLATDKFIFIALLFIYNYYSISTVFVLLASTLFAVFCGGALKLVYLSPRPFMYDAAIYPLSCEGGFGNPSNHATCATCFYLTLYDLTINKSERLLPASKLKLKQFMILLITCICVSRIFLGVHSINQVLLGCCVGFAVYYSLFRIVQLQHNNNMQQVIMCIIYNGGRFITCVVVVIVIAFIPAVVLLDVSYAEWNEQLEMKCKGLPSAKRFEYESYTCIMCLTVLISAYLGIAYEYYYTFKGDVAKWVRYNFDSSDDNDNGIDISLLMNDNDNEGGNDNSNSITRWNKTNESNVNIKRLCVIITCCGVLMLPHVLISYEHSYYVIITFKILLPLYIITFLMFSFMKTLCHLCSCTNDHLITFPSQPTVI